MDFLVLLKLSGMAREEEGTVQCKESEKTIDIPLFRLNKMQKSIKYQGVKAWNSVPAEIRMMPPVWFKR